MMAPSFKGLHAVDTFTPAAGGSYKYLQDEYDCISRIPVRDYLEPDIELHA
jgi:hypothetical protein